MVSVSSSCGWRKQSPSNLPDDGCETWHGNWTKVNRCIITTRHLSFSALWKHLLLYTWWEVEKWENLSLDSWLQNLMPGSSAAILSQWSISKSTLDIETVVTQEMLVMVLWDSICCSFSCQSMMAIWDLAGDDILFLSTSCLWQALIHRRQRRCFLHLLRLWEYPFTWWAAIGKKGEPQPRRVLRRSIVALQKQLN